jgi:superoxide dismutase, Fe-Mn family
MAIAPPTVGGRNMKYTLPALPYAYDALEPVVDEQTMRVHHCGHHKAYVDKLNKILEPYPKLQLPVDDLLSRLETLPADIRTEVENNAGGHANHTLFWSVLAPGSSKEPTGEIAQAIARDFGNFRNFREKFEEQGTKHFSNGWVWLCAENNGSLSLLTTKDHESPLTRGLTPLFVMDLWEHAYYLKHQNKRPAYLAGMWNVANWPEVGRRWEDFNQNGYSNREWREAI